MTCTFVWLLTPYTPWTPHLLWVCGSYTLYTLDTLAPLGAWVLQYTFDACLVWVCVVLHLIHLGRLGSSAGAPALLALKSNVQALHLGCFPVRVMRIAWLARCLALLHGSNVNSRCLVGRSASGQPTEIIVKNDVPLYRRLSRAAEAARCRGWGGRAGRNHCKKRRTTVPLRCRGRVLQRLSLILGTRKQGLTLF